LVLCKRAAVPVDGGGGDDGGGDEGGDENVANGDGNDRGQTHSATAKVPYLGEMLNDWQTRRPTRAEMDAKTRRSGELG
jgi:hypothetical protein